MTTVRDLFTLQPAVERLREARRVYHLTDPADRREWQRVAYEPRVDYGETPTLKPGYREDGEWGCIDGSV